MQCAARCHDDVTRCCDVIVELLLLQLKQLTLHAREKCSGGSTGAAGEFGEAAK